MIRAFKEMLNRWNDFTGRTDTATYWWATLANVIFTAVVSLVLTVVFFIFFAAADAESSFIFGTIIGSLFVLVLGALFIFIEIAGLAMLVRRLRDAGFQWFFIFVNLIPSVGQIAVIIMCCLPSRDTWYIDFQGGSQTTSTYTPNYQSSNTPNTPETPVVDVTVDEAPVVEEDTWVCECGSKNTGKFCPICGKEKK